MFQKDTALERSPVISFDPFTFLTFNPLCFSSRYGLPGEYKVDCCTAT